MVHDHHRLFCDRVTKRLTTGQHHARVEGVVQPLRLPILVAMEHPSPLDPPLAPGGQLNDALRLWPGRGHRGSKRQAGVITRSARALPLRLVCRPGGQCTVTAGTGLRITETLARRSPPCPATTGRCGQPLARRETEALRGGVGAPRHHRLESTGRCCARVVRTGLVVWGAWAWSTTARWIRQTLGAMRCPWLDPGRHGDPMDLRGFGQGLEGRAGGTQQQTLGAAPRAEGGLLCHRCFSECTVLLGHRLPISHDHHLIRS